MTMISPERYADGIKDLSYEKLAAAERLLSSERARLHGSKGYAVEEIEKNMRAAIKKGAATENEDTANTKGR